VSMVTRCPSCNTVFHVTPQQLQAHHGDVRCGRCMMVFDGFKGLTVLPAPNATEPEKHIQSPKAPRQVIPDDPAAEQQQETAHHDQQLAEAGSGTFPEPSIPGFEFEPVSLPVSAYSAPESESLERKDDSISGDDRAAALRVGAPEETFPEDATVERARRQSWLWAVGSILLLLVLAGQASYYYRVELAATHPALKSVLTRLCDAAGCDVPLPQRPKLIYIEASDMQVVDPARPDVIRLTATLRNHAGYDVAFPALDLVLTNTRDHGVARRIFMPGEYLDAGKKLKSGIPASGEVTIRLDLDIGNLDAAGFRLALLAAPVS